MRPEDIERGIQDIASDSNALDLMTRMLEDQNEILKRMIDKLGPVEPEKPSLKKMVRTFFVDITPDSQ